MNRGDSMAIKVNSGFDVGAATFLDSRQRYETLEEMRNANVNILPDGIVAYNHETKDYYKYDSTNDIDENTGKWRILSTSGSGSSTEIDVMTKTEYENFWNNLEVNPSTLP